MKRIFTLWMAGILLTGAFSVAKAQTSISGDFGIPGTEYRISVARGYVFNGCKYTLNFEWGEYFIINTCKVNILKNSTEQLLNEDLLISEKSMTVTLNPERAPVGMTFYLNFVISLTVSFSYTDPNPIILTYIDYPTVTSDLTGRDLYDYYYDRTTQYPGKIEFARKGGSPDLEYSVDGFHWGKFPDSTLALTPLDIQNLIPGSKILVHEPYGCMGETPFIDVPEQSGVAGVISRMIYIPPVEDVTIIPGPGIHYVPSGKNYVFKIQPTGSNAGLRPEVVTDRRRFIPDEESISYQANEDGVWTVTLFSVREPLNLDITFTGAETKSTVTGVAAVEDNRVWGADGTLYIVSATAGNAGIYSAAGALVKTVAYSPGTTATPLPAGFYIASLDYGNYKVIVN